MTVLGLGGAALDERSFVDGVATVKMALDLGINYFDVAPAYCRGASQVIMGKALEGCTRPYLLATKLGYLGAPAHYRSKDALRAQLWENLRALRRNKVDVLQVHLSEWACWWEDGAPEGQLLTCGKSYDFADAPVMQVLREAKERGLCRFIGITADHAEELAYVLKYVEVDTCLVAYDLSPLIRRARRTALPLAQEKGVAYIAAGVIKPYFTGVNPKWISEPPPWMPPEVLPGLARLYEVQRACGLSLVNLSVRYLLAEPSISTILVGSATPAHLEEAVAAAQAGPLPPDLHRAIEELGLP